MIRTVALLFAAATVAASPALATEVKPAQTNRPAITGQAAPQAAPQTTPARPATAQTTNGVAKPGEATGTQARPANGAQSRPAATGTTAPSATGTPAPTTTR
jgi:hypothetical protein